MLSLFYHIFVFIRKMKKMLCGVPNKEVKPKDINEENLNNKNFFMKMIYPFAVIYDFKTEFSIWALFTLLAGQLGIVTNILIRKFGTESSVFDSLYLDAQAGNFYIYAIAIVASMLGGVFTTFLSSKELSFRHIRMIASSLLVLFLIFISIIYSATQLKISNGMPPIGPEIKYNVDWLQLFIYLFSMVIAVYCFCIIKLHLPKFQILSSAEDYSSKETQAVDELSSSIKQINSDGNLKL